MEDFLTIGVIIYLAGVVGVALAGDKRTIGGAGALALAVFATPLVAAILILSWPSQMEAEAYYREQARKAKEG